MNKLNENQSGNILFLILIAVALFAALSYAVNSSNRTGSSKAGNETTLVASSDLTQYAAAISNAMTVLKVSNRCADHEISFERAPFDGSDTDYVNAAARPDFSCHVFHTNGGQASSRNAPKNTNDGRDWTYGEVVILGIGADQTDCGSDCSDLALILGGIRKGTCEKINEKITGSTAIPVQDDGQDYENAAFSGTYSGALDIDGDAQGQFTLCTQAADGDHYFYHVLMPR